jgi:NADP-dependent 3-hydroxy acid dehydrogenase YdfG
MRKEWSTNQQQNEMLEDDGIDARQIARTVLFAITLANSLQM